MSTTPTAPSGPNPDLCFRTTRWSLVRAAGGPSDGDSRAAFEELCRAYWHPVYAVIRRRCGDATKAQDLTQEFFTRLIEKNYLADVRQERGRFRAFLHVAVRHFLSKEWSKAHSQKRGGGQVLWSLDFAVGEERCLLDPQHNETPERLFDRQWALQLLELVQTRLREEYRQTEKEPLYDRLQPCLVGESESYERIAETLQMTVGAVKTAVYRLRQRFRELLRSEIVQTVSHPDEVDDEIRELFAALG